MKNLPKFVALAFFAVALTGAAIAQDAIAQDNAHVLHANIPFSFYAGGQLLPAGEYTISVNIEEHTVTIGQKATGSTSTLLGSPDDSSRDYRTVLTFNLATNDVYALREIQSPGVGVSFNAKGPAGAMRAKNQKQQSVVIIAEAR
jgi:hypothetical protein